MINIVMFSWSFISFSTIHRAYYSYLFFKKQKESEGP